MSRHAIVSTKHLPLSLRAPRAIDDAGRLGERWAALHRILAVWRHRARTRAELRLIPDHQLKDVPFDMSTIANERAKPFWKE